MSANVELGESDWASLYTALRWFVEHGPDDLKPNANKTRITGLTNRVVHQVKATATPAADMSDLVMLPPVL